MINLLFVGFLLFSIELKSQSLEDPNTSPVHTLGTIEKDTLKFLRNQSFNPEWVKDLKLLLPCKNVNLSKRSSRLPNAPRKYRNGTHRGIDFFANWGSNVRAVAPGVIVRSDQHYREYPADFREKMLQSCGIVGHTPSDIFNNVLLGKSIIIDHVNRSGVFHLKGNTPFKQRPMFPDMSYIYEKDLSLKNIIVQTLGYERFKKVELKERVFVSEAAAIIATIWHYVGVRVRGFAIPTK